MVASFSIETEFDITYSVCGYLVYCHVPDAGLRETLVCGRKPTNEKYRYVFAVIEILEERHITPIDSDHNVLLTVFAQINNG